MSARAEHQDAEPDVRPDAARHYMPETGWARGRAASLLALQRSAGNRAVGRLLAREPAPPPEASSVDTQIRELEETIHHPVSAEDREVLERALSASAGPATHSPLTVGLTAVEHPVKTLEHVGPKALIPDELGEEDYLLRRFPNLFGELVSFFAATDATPTVNVLTLFDYHFGEQPYAAYNVYNYLAAKRGEIPVPQRLVVTPSMFGDVPEDIQEASLRLGSFNVFAERVNVAGADGKQFKLRVTDSLGLQEGQKGAFWLMSFVVGSKNVTLAEYLGTVDAAGHVDVKPWPGG